MISKDPARAARAVGTFGLSETGLAEKMSNLDPTKKVEADTGAIDAATKSATSWQDELKKKMSDSQRVTPSSYAASSVGLPQQVRGVAPQVVAGAPVGDIAGKVGSVNTMGVQQAGTNVNEAMNLQQQAATGAAPSFSEMLIKKNAENQIKQQMAAQGGRAFDAAANRNIANKSIEIGQAAGTEAAGIRAQEMAAARGQYADIATQNRNQMMQMSMADATNKLQSLSSDQQAQVNQRAQNLQASGMNAENALKAAMADQASTLAMATSNAQLSQQMNLANIEADLKAKGMTNDQINFYLSQITGIEQSKMGGAQQASSLASGANQATQANRSAFTSAALGGIAGGAAKVFGGG